MTKAATMQTSKENFGDAWFPDELSPLFESWRYKILWGGRGGAKSWGVARALLLLGSQKPLRILCGRELQKSIKDSVHRLLSDQIVELGMEHLYTVNTISIKGVNGTEFFFEGLRHNTNQIKSYEGIDICWIEEAQTVSKSSWDLIIPTIRKDNSEIWVSFNPELEQDETYQRFILKTPSNAVVIKINFRDNPWFPKVLEQERLDCKLRDPIGYDTIWEGHCRQAVEGAIYQDELNQAHTDGRIMKVPHDPSKPVNTFWDLGYSDQTSIWFVQKQGFEYHAIDFYQNARKKIQHYLKVIKEKPYIYGTDYLPHDGKNEYLVASSVQETMESLGRKVERVERVAKKYQMLSAVRTIFPMCYFDAEKCADGLTSLRRYRYKVDPDTQITSKDPLHDIYSNGADAFGTFATAPTIMWEAYTGHEGAEHKTDWEPEQ